MGGDWWGRACLEGAGPRFVSGQEVANLKAI